MAGLFHRPLNPWFVGQKFGENKACVDNATSTKIVNCDGLNPPPGYRSLYGLKGHTGIDVGAYHGQEVYCAQAGVVDYVDTNPRTGLDVRVVSEIGGKKYRHIYEHLLGYQHPMGARVKTGELIGWANNTGWSAGDHLHFQIEEWQDGGGWVAVDPEPLLSEFFALNVLYVNDKLAWLREQIAKLADTIADYLRSKGRMT